MKINNLPIANDQRLTVFGGVNVIESDDLLFRVAEEFKSVAEKYKFSYVFKASFDKANRSSADSFRGPGLEKGLERIDLKPVKRPSGAISSQISSVRENRRFLSIYSLDF